MLWKETIHPRQNLPNLESHLIKMMRTHNKSKSVNKVDLDWINEVTECPVYHPSKEEFDDPLDYLQKIAPEASKYGICKIVPPLNSSAPAGIVLTKEKRGFKFTTRVQPLKLTDSSSNTFFARGRNYTLRDFETMANKATASRYCVSGCLPSKYIEQQFWHQLTARKKGTVEYGINIDGSAFSCSCNDELGRSKWNLNTLPRLPKSMLRLVQSAIPVRQQYCSLGKEDDGMLGYLYSKLWYWNRMEKRKLLLRIQCQCLGVTDPMLYIGMLFSMFAWHVEDHYLNSINYHHCGAPKTWYGVPSYAAFEFEKVAQHWIYSHQVLSSDDGIDRAFDLLAEKTTMFSPKNLLQNSVPVYKALQHPGEFVITFPRAYHAGFSHGFNCGEAVNFATDDWFPFGAEATQRYSCLSRMPIIPYEELVCKEAMLLSTTSSHTAVLFVKASFAHLIKSHKNARSCLKRLNRSLRILTNLEGTIFCGLCKRDCYLSYISCNCNVDPICVFHEREVSNCGCGRNCILSMRGDMKEMEAVATKFEHKNLSSNKRSSRLVLAATRKKHQIIKAKGAEK